MAKAKLAPYRAKRTPGQTPEPIPEAEPDAPDAAAPRFVVQEHHATRLHWDLRLERDGVLVSWAIPNGIPDAPGTNRKAVHTEDHPLEYLDFHGEIPKGNYGAGTMTIWDHGTYELLKWEPRKVEVHLHGERLHGRYALFATERPPPGEPDAFLKEWMIHRMDPPADPALAAAMPDRLVPMLAKAAALPTAREDAGWAYEIKWDGVRALAYSEPGRLRLQSRNLNDITHGYPEISKLNRALSSHRAILDGELVAFDPEGRPSFSRLQQRMHNSEAQARRRMKDVPVTYVIFDLLWLDGHSLMGLPYADRRTLLAELALDGPSWQTPEHVVGNGKAFLAASAAQELEGVIAKRLDSVYEPGKRGSAWRKLKNVARQEVVVGGWLPGEGKRKERIGALLVGVTDEGDGSHPPELRYAGRVGTGFTQDELDRLATVLGACERTSSPFTEGTAPRGAIFVEPRYLAEVEFTEWTKDGMLRHPSYKGLRADKSARDVVREAVPGEVEIEGRTLKLTNLDKVLYPQAGFTKRDVIDYMVAIAPVLLPHLEGRPLTLKRYPNGVDAAFFYEKQCPKHRPDWMATAPVQMSSKTIDFCLAQDVPTLVWLANLADLELHTSLARAASIDTPTMLVFDLDPGAPADIVQCCEVGLWLEGMFAGLGLQSFAKTSGSKGLQIYVPLNDPAVTYADTKPFAKAVAELLEATEPKLVVSRMTKAIRGGKILVDWSQNHLTKTTVNVYSLRARDQPTVSTPVTWDEVRACHASQDAADLVFTSADVLRRVEEQGDLFAPTLSLVQQLPAL